MDLMLRRKRTILAFVLPALLIYICIVLVPIFNTAYHSAFKWNILGAKKFVGIDNFVNLFTKDKIFQTSMINTFVLMFASLVIQTPLAILLAIALSGTIRGKRYFKTVFFLPNILSSVAVGLLWTFIYNPEFGIINKVLEFLGLGGLTRLWLADKKTVLPSIIVTICWQFVGYHMILYLAAVENIPKEIKEAALIDGVNNWTMIRYITLPLIRHVIRIDTVLMATGSLRFFDLIYVMSNGGPNHASEVIASYMYYKSFRDMQYGYGSAVAMVLLVLCLLITFILNRVFHSDKVEY
ncbi:MAG: sugar ABC transporter permease [Ruminiclostridium sp.]|nr:sugar ABC transporter permease [Ruminiclostridium sp.]